MEMNLIPEIDFVPHTIFLLCGPTHSGKSTFAEDLMHLADYAVLTSKIISSDTIRRKLLSLSNVSSYGGYGKDSRYSDGMGAVSKQAFDMLMTELKVLVSYPISTEIIVVDTTGMDENFRKEVKKIGNNCGYKVVLVTFEYKSRSDYLPGKDVSEEARFIIQKSVMKFRSKVLPAIPVRDFDGRLRIKSKLSFGWDLHGGEDGDVDLWDENASSVKAKEKQELFHGCTDLGYENEAVVKGSWLEAAAEQEERLRSGPPVYAVIGDSHECTEELKTLIDKLETEIPFVRIVHIGDYLDKGGDTVGMIEYMYDRLGKGDIIVQGNHEAYVVRKLRGEISSTMDPELEKDYFSSLQVLNDGSRLANDLKEKLFTIFDSSKPFAILCDYDEKGGVYVIVTHAPCSNKFLGKVHDEALRNQRNYRVEDRSKPTLEELAWMYKEADFSHPIHIFGHIAHKVTDKAKGIRYKNKVFLDTGAVHGGGLTAAIVTGGRIKTYISVPSKERFKSELPENLGHGPINTKVFNIYDYDLDPRDLRLLDQVMDNGIKYISGTMAPAPSGGDKLEPLSGALDWYKKLGVKSVVLQPKYMGSRCQMYLFKEGPEKTFATSRAGWIIKGVQGKDEEGYKAFLSSVWETHKKSIETLGDLILDGELLPWHALGAGLIDKNFTPYGSLVNSQLETLSGDEGFKALTGFKEVFNLEEKKDHLNRFNHALGLYASPGEPEFKAFNILKPSLVESHLGRFMAINPDECRVVYLENENALEEAQIFFDKLTVGQGFEGVVVKPMFEGDCELPYLKVRSEEYLRLVYGYDYLDPKRYSRLVRQKNISGKVRLSIQEHKLASAMLTSEGDAKKEIVVKLIGSMKEEQGLDPRL
jgi:predicted kinase